MVDGKYGRIDNLGTFTMAMVKGEEFVLGYLDQVLVKGEIIKADIDGFPDCEVTEVYSNFSVPESIRIGEKTIRTCILRCKNI